MSDRTMSDQNIRQQGAPAVCPSCAAEFLCGASSEGQCWCASLPNVIAPVANHCWCPSCLDAQIRKAQAERDHN